MTPKFNKKRIVYTVNFGNYDTLRPIEFLSDLDFICFTDNKDLKVKGWTTYFYDDHDLSVLEKNRKIKIFPHHFLKDIDESLYVDGNISFQKDPDYLFDKYLNNQNYLAIARHPLRNCLYKESIDLLYSTWLSENEKKKLKVQIEKYRSLNMPKNFGLPENNIILRDHHSLTNSLMSDLWWFELNNGCKRDQISLPYVLWKEKIKFSLIEETPRFSKEIFNIHLHNKQISKNKLITFKRKMRIRFKQSLAINILNRFINIIDTLNKFSNQTFGARHIIK